ncbi:hypothetical protein A0J57_18165 [Sphingobium sp. 22B]|uniref:hypothetical protein n=1 Tax=unclassified Sphingobium TaxID=2611147 RepID=UPI000785F03E|nr:MULTISPECIES: hypothetical protein [unclassified Sphingobium]KXU29947.1 hypothetical protein AXW74_20425 [Sphingobium sp. AM]KYC30917.1 hypothetical protein A0J57_18165 [Sphingobium sp. 22B]OAP30449.1 hypothetical protein A8O16_18455 [Sphingobium sp. 20006FA]
MTYSRKLDGPGDEDDAERWEATDNVPTPLVFTLDYDIFRDQRMVVGVSNLLTSYRANGQEVRSADTGNVHRCTGHDRRPGIPV